MLIFHKCRIIDIILDGSIKNERDGDFRILYFFQDFLVILGYEFFKLVDEFECFGGDAFEIYLSGGK